jgi:hypothetical protein
MSGDINFECHLNNFLSSAQAVIHNLNTSFSKNKEYKNWANERTERLPRIAGIFKELRNISLKEGPVEHEACIVDVRMPEEVIIPPYAELITPWIDTQTGKVVGDLVINYPDGSKKSFKPIVVHDFMIQVESGKKVYKIDRFLTKAKEYVSALENEINFAEENFPIPSQ